MGAVVTLRYGTNLPAADVQARFTRAGSNWNAVRRVCSDLLDPIAGVQGGGIVYTVDDVTAGTPLADVSVTATCTQASIVQDDTVVIGNVTLTWRTSASNENQVTIGASNTAAATNLAAAINAHSKLAGVISATSAVGVVTVTYTGAGREAALIGLSETGSGVVLSATSFTSGATLAAESSAPTKVTKGL